MNSGKTYLIKIICAFLTIGTFAMNCSQTLDKGKMEIIAQYNFFDMYEKDLNGFNPGSGLKFSVFKVSDEKTIFLGGSKDLYEFYRKSGDSAVLFVSKDMGKSYEEIIFPEENIISIINADKHSVLVSNIGGNGVNSKNVLYILNNDTYEFNKIEELSTKENISNIQINDNYFVYSLDKKYYALDIITRSKYALPEDVVKSGFILDKKKSNILYLDNHHVKSYDFLNSNTQIVKKLENSYTTISNKYGDILLGKVNILKNGGTMYNMNEKELFEISTKTSSFYRYKNFVCTITQSMPKLSLKYSYDYGITWKEYSNDNYIISSNPIGFYKDKYIILDAGLYKKADSQESGKRIIMADFKK